MGYGGNYQLIISYCFILIYHLCEIGFGYGGFGHGGFNNVDYGDNINNSTTTNNYYSNDTTNNNEENTTNNDNSTNYNDNGTNCNDNGNQGDNGDEFFQHFIFYIPK
jgi:hypothetical protein